MMPSSANNRARSSTLRSSRMLPGQAQAFRFPETWLARVCASERAFLKAEELALGRRLAHQTLGAGTCRGAAHGGQAFDMGHDLALGIQDGPQFHVEMLGLARRFVDVQHAVGALQFESAHGTSWWCETRWHLSPMKGLPTVPNWRW